VPIDRPDVKFEPTAHTYSTDGRDLLGVSTVAKIGGVEDTWGIASAWGFRIGYEGSYDLYLQQVLQQCDTKDDLRSELKKRGLTPWSKRDKAAERGTWVHDTWEQLAQDGTVPDLDSMPEEVREHVRAILRFHLEYRPTYIATEVQVTSTKHGFAGRYDIRCLIDVKKIAPKLVDHDTPQANRVNAMLAYKPDEQALCLIDLKTSKGVYPLTHFPQLAGYEGAGLEMGFPSTDAQFVLNTHPDGTYELVASWAQYDHFLAYLGATKAIHRLRAADPDVKHQRRLEKAVLAALPGASRDLVMSIPELREHTPKQLGIMLSKLRKKGLVSQTGGIWERQPSLQVESTSD
jgi:hypothetical protein